MNNFKNVISAAVFAAFLSCSGAVAFQAPAAKSAKATTAKAEKPSPMSPVSDKEIADARAKGLVWVNTSSKVYHKEGEFYGKTKQGKFMTEADAIKGGNRAAKSPATKKKTTPKK